MSEPADLKLLEEELDAECARELAAAFLEDAATAVAGIQNAIRDRKLEELKVHAHGLKGCCRTIKANEAEGLSTDLESAAIAQDWQRVAAVLPQLAAKYHELRAYIEGYIA